ncbi:MAG TPA: SDR family NAD(P)-dependent oxidoreductase [Solirubrobacterales bacterium]|nr:SDR family NAD(P)-dependent oxidoreductase [Solirubrobacterales bacterium]
MSVVVTGASSGIGEAAAVELARRGATVVPVGRDERRLRAVAERIGELGSAGEPERADFASLDDVRDLAARLLERHPRIDVLVNNAGAFFGRREVSVDGHELTFQVNHLAPFLLTNLLLDRLRASAPSRVVTTSSGVHAGGLLDLDDLELERSWSGWRAYSNSKLANVLFTRELAKRLEGTGVVANCLHPGVIRSRLGRNAGGVTGIGWSAVRLLLGSPRRGARTVVYLASAPEAQRVSGGYFAGERQRRVVGQAADDFVAEELWRRSEQLAGLAEPASSRS